jgi:hypothetical protein
MPHNTEKIRMIQMDLRAALDEVGKKHGVSIATGALSYNDLYFTVSLKGRFLDANGSTEEADKAIWALYCRKFGLMSEWFGKMVKIGADTYKIVGIAPKARKYPVLAEAHGKKYKLPAADVIFGMSNAHKEGFLVKEIEDRIASGQN